MNDEDIRRVRNNAWKLGDPAAERAVTWIARACMFAQQIERALDRDAMVHLNSGDPVERLRTLRLEVSEAYTGFVGETRGAIGTEGVLGP